MAMDDKPYRPDIDGLRGIVNAVKTLDQMLARGFDSGVESKP
jgi:tetrahydromethanopterin S-methyltransferase subunit F